MSENTKISSIKWKYRELIRALGGVSGIKEHFLSRGVEPPPEDTIRGWRTRNSIPGKWSPLVIMIAMEENILKSVQQLIKDTQ